MFAKEGERECVCACVCLCMWGGTLSRNSPVLVQPAASHHETSTDRRIHESPVIEKIMHKQPNEGRWGKGGGGGMEGGVSDCRMPADAYSEMCVGLMGGGCFSMYG